MGIEGKVVLVTGATSGIGAACADVFAAAGAALVLTGRDETRGQAVLEVVKARGARALFITGDVTDRAFCDRLVDQTVERLGRLDVLINNAGIFVMGDAPGTSDALWLDTMAVNVDSVFFLSRAAVRAMRKTGGGSIVNVASDWGLTAGRNHVAYCTSKGAVVQMTRAMAIDHADDKIRVNAVCPGAVLTPMIERGIHERGMSREEGVQAIARNNPLGRLAEPDEIARAILFLASDSVGYMTGACLAVDGGNTAR